MAFSIACSVTALFVSIVAVYNIKKLREEVYNERS